MAAKITPGQRTTVPSRASCRMELAFSAGRCAVSSPRKDNVRIPDLRPAPQGGPILAATLELVDMLKRADAHRPGPDPRWRRHALGKQRLFRAVDRGFHRFHRPFEPDPRTGSCRAR